MFQQNKKGMRDLFHKRRILPRKCNIIPLQN